MRASWFLGAWLALSVVGCGEDTATEDAPGSSKGGSAQAGKGGSSSGQGGSDGGTAGAGAGGAAGSAAGAPAAGTGGSGQAGQGGSAAGQGGEASAGAGGEAGGGGAAGQDGGQGGAAGEGGGGQGGSAGTGGGCGACDQPGQVCLGGQCLDDCRRTGSVPCGEGTVCDVGSEHEGKCVAPGDGCVISNPTVACGAGTCGPGTDCGPSGTCTLQPPCTKLVCVGGTCWGEACSCTRPAPACVPAPLGAPGEAGTLNDPAFVRQGKNAGEGAFDLDFDPDCNAWAVTMISGPDYLRKVDPAGQVTSITGVTNLNMGEVAVLTGKEGVFGGGSGDVALTYICCATCGCILSGSGGNPQGAAIFDENGGTLPMKIPTEKYTGGKGPFGVASLDTGPYGLSWGLDRVLYLGNVQENGDFVALDLLGGSTTPIVLFPARVNATAPFDRDRMVVALEGGQVWLVPILGIAAAPVELLKLPADVTSLLRDPWSGRLYAELSNLDIVSFKPDGSDLMTFAKAPAKGRIALAPDGYLYHLTVYPTPAEVIRFPMPTGL